MSERLADQLTIRIATTERAHLERIAHEQRRSVGDVVRDGVKIILAHNQSTRASAPIEA